MVYRHVLMCYNILYMSQKYNNTGTLYLPTYYIINTVMLHNLYIFVM